MYPLVKSLYPIKFWLAARALNWCDMAPVPGGPRDISAKFVEFEDFNEDPVDTAYYISALNSILRSICKCIGVSRVIQLQQHLDLLSNMNMDVAYNFKPK